MKTLSIILISAALGMCLINTPKIEAYNVPKLPKIRVAVIGAGTGGLSSIHHVADIPDAEVVGFEIHSEIGGTWVYRDNVSNNQSVMPLMTTMYKSLRTNLPKEVMSFPDYLPRKELPSFLHNTQFLDYIKSYADHFDLRKYIKFQHMVTLVKPFENGWKVTYINLFNNEETTEEFDYVFICNGHYTKPNMPDIKGQDIFKGRQIHSRYYKVPDPYKNKTVLLIGFGSSGLDISAEVAKHAKKVILSHHYPGILLSTFPSNHFQKPDLKEFTENSAIFEDGTSEDIDEIIYCTGYEYSTPFLDKSCKINVEKKRIYPLYRQIVNVEYPTMFFIGMPQAACAIPLRDMQARYAVASIKGDFKFPSKEDMLKQIDDEYARKDKIIEKGKNGFHDLGAFEPFYYTEMAAESGIIPVSPVLYSIRMAATITRRNIFTFRNYEYEVIDDNSFKQSYKNP